LEAGRAVALPFQQIIWIAWRKQSNDLTPGTFRATLGGDLPAAAKKQKYFSESLFVFRRKSYTFAIAFERRG
jgi:hypothetical protein